MVHILRFVLAFAILWGASVPAQAGPFTDDLKRCLVNSTSTADRVAFARWVVSAIGAHPEVAPIVGISDEMRDETSRRTSELLQDLLTVRCREQAKIAVEIEGAVSIASAFEVVGQVAMTTLFQDPNVNAELGRLDKFIDVEELQKALGIR